MYKLFIKKAPGGRGKTKPCKPRLIGSYHDVEEFAMQLKAMHNSIKDHTNDSKLSDWYDIYSGINKLDADDPVWLKI